MYFIYFFLIIILYFILHFFYNEIYPPIWPDEVLFSSAAKNLALGNDFKTDVLEGIIYGMDQATLWITPLYIILLSSLYYFTGESLFIGRTFSFVIGILNLIIFYKLLNHITTNKKISIFFVFLLAIEYSFLRGSNIIRMEILNLFFILCSVYFLEKKSFFSGLFIGLAGLTHPISIFLVLFVFFYFKNLKDILKIFFIAFLIMSPWFFYAIYYWDIFQFQFLAQLTRKTTHYEFQSLIYFFKVIGGQFQSKINFFLVFSFFIFVFIVGIYFFKFYEKKYFFLNLVVIFTVFFSSESWYVIYLFPFMLMHLGSYINLNKNIKWISLIISFILIGFIQIIILIKLFKIKNEYKEEYNQWIFFLNQNLKECNSIYLFTIPDPYFHLEKNKIYKEFPPYGLLKSDFGKNYNLVRLNTFKQIDCFVISDKEKKDKELENFLMNNKFQKIPYPEMKFLPNGYIYKKL